MIYSSSKNSRSRERLHLLTMTGTASIISDHIFSFFEGTVYASRFKLKFQFFFYSGTTKKSGIVIISKHCQHRWPRAHKLLANATISHTLCVCDAADHRTTSKRKHVLHVVIQVHELEVSIGAQKQREGRQLALVVCDIWRRYIVGV